MSADPSARRGIPDATVARLPEYLRALTGLAERGITSVSSEELAAAAGVRSAKLRKDLSHLGSYGVRGVGYEVDHLAYQISRELGLTQDWPVAIVGMGNLGHALAAYSGFATRGFRVVALLDQDGPAARPGDRRPARCSRWTDARPSWSPTRAWPSASSPPRPPPPRRSATSWWPPGCARSSTSPRACSSCPTDVDVRKVDLSTELQILAFHEQRKALAAEGALDAPSPTAGAADEPA